MIDGLVSVKSKNNTSQTKARLIAALKEKSITVFCDIDHAAGASAVGQDLHPTELVIFGNPMSGTALMQAAQTAGIDLPLKALIWQDDKDVVWLSYNDPAWIAKRHGIEATAMKAVGELTKALAAFAAHATASS